jgi:hypothetical protein
VYRDLLTANRLRTRGGDTMTNVTKNADFNQVSRYKACLTT